MIGYLEGKVIHQSDSFDKGVGEVLIGVAGVGYYVFVTSATAEALNANSKPLYIYHHITEADQRLFGFLDLKERQAFKSLLSAHGVGPSLAMSVLSFYSIDSLVKIIESEHIDALCEIPGVGKKTAQRLLIELKNNLDISKLDIDSEAGIDLRNDLDPLDPIVDVRLALENLGYTSHEISQVLSRMETSQYQDSGELLKAALRLLSENVR